MVLASIGGMMEKKIKLLENRLSLVERFVEMRFCESFRDFSIRNNNLINEEDDDNDSSAVKRGGRKGGDRSVITVKIIKNGGQDEDKAKKCAVGRRSPRISAKQRRKQPKRRQGKVKDQSEMESDVVVVTKAKVEQEEPLTAEEVEDEGREDGVDGTGGDDYFTFPAGGGGDDGGSQEEEDGEGEETMEQEDDPLHDSGDNLSEADEVLDKSPPKKKKASSAGSGAKKVKRKYKIRQRIIKTSPEDLLTTKECPICHVQCKPSAYPAHVAMHGMERHLKCGFCDKRFHNKAMLLKHERIHQPEKYGKICRVKGCGKVIIQTTRMLGHERSCIRKALENGVEVDGEVMEEIRRRSQNVDLNWPGDGDGKRRKCNVCRKEVMKKEWLKHMRGHARWKCDKCGDKRAVFTEKRSLLRHNKDFHGGKGGSSGGGGGKEDESEEVENEEGMEGEREMEDDGGEEGMVGLVGEVIREEEVRTILEN